MSVLRGEKVRDLKDRSGKKMTDVYLCQKLGEEFEWVPRVYERTSGYVHLSSTHPMSALSPSSGADADDWTFTIKISAEDKPLPGNNLHRGIRCVPSGDWHPSAICGGVDFH